MVGYTYSGLKNWTGRVTADGAAFDDPDDFWNEHQFYYECKFEGKYYAFKPDLVGYADGRVQVQIIHPDYSDLIDMEYDPVCEIWAEYVPGRVKAIHYVCICSVLPEELEPLLHAAVKRCRNYTDSMQL